VCRASFPQCSCRNTSTFLQWKSSFESAFEFLRIERPLKCCCRAFDSTPHGSETSRISSAYLRLCRSKAYLPTDAPKKPRLLSVFLQEHWCATWALRVALSTATAGRLCSFRNTSTFSAIEIEFGICLRVHTGRKDRLSVAPKTFGSTPQGPKRPESHQPFFSCAGVKPTPQQGAQNHASGSVFLQEHWCATWTLPQIARSAAPLGGYVPSGTLPRTALPLTPSRCIPIVEGRVNSPPTTMTVVFLQEHSTGFAHNSCFCT
jgi:hypothetical protein